MDLQELGSGIVTTGLKLKESSSMLEPCVIELADMVGSVAVSPSPSSDTSIQQQLFL